MVSRLLFLAQLQTASWNSSRVLINSVFAEVHSESYTSMAYL